MARRRSLSRSSPPSFSGFGLGMQPPYKLGLPRTLLPNPRSTRTTGMRKGSGVTSILRGAVFSSEFLLEMPVRYPGFRKTMFPSKSSGCGCPGFGRLDVDNRAEISFKLFLRFREGRASGEHGLGERTFLPMRKLVAGSFGAVACRHRKKGRPSDRPGADLMERRKPWDRVS